MTKFYLVLPQMLMILNINYFKIILFEFKF